MHTISGSPLEPTQLSYILWKNVKYLPLVICCGKKEKISPWRQCQGLRTQPGQPRARLLPHSCSQRAAERSTGCQRLGCAFLGSAIWTSAQWGCKSHLCLPARVPKCLGGTCYVKSEEKAGEKIQSSALRDCLGEVGGGVGVEFSATTAGSVHSTLHHSLPDLHMPSFA